MRVRSRGRSVGNRLSRLAINPQPSTIDLFHHGIIERPEVPIDLFFVNLIVGDGSLKKTVPIHEPLASEDQAVFEHLEERLPHRARADFVQREPHPPPVATGTEPFQLAEDALLVNVLPFPNPLDEGFAPDVVPRQPLLFKHPFFDDRLRGDPRVIGPRHPERFVALHPSPPSQQVLQRAVQRMPHVQRPGHVRQRNHDDMRRLGRIGVRIEVAAFLPKGKPFGFGGGGIVLLGDFGGHEVSLREESASRKERINH